jgi:hypothetical protein
MSSGGGAAVTVILRKTTMTAQRLLRMSPRVQTRYGRRQGDEGFCERWPLCFGQDQEVEVQNVGEGVEDAVTGYKFGANFRTDGVSYTPDYVKQLTEARTKRQANFAQPNSTIGNHFTGSGEKLTQP